MGFLVRIPKLPDNCQDCGRKLDGRIQDNPYGCWSIPVVNGADGVTRCTYCDEMKRSGDPAARLPAGCKSLQNLNRWLKKGTN